MKKTGSYYHYQKCFITKKGPNYDITGRYIKAASKRPILRSIKDCVIWINTEIKIDEYNVRQK